MVECGASFYDPNARAAVAGVDTLVRRGTELARYLPTVTLWVQDEAHHVLESNKWGTAAKMFPNAKGLGVTATPCRADGAGLGRHHDGLFDALIVGPTMRRLITDGHLTEYRIFAPPSDVDLSNVAMSKATGDYNVNQMRDAIGHSSLIVSDGKAKIVGDIVSHYKRIAPGKLGVTFVPSVEQATEVAKQFNESDIPAEVVSAKTPDDQRAAIMRKFKDRRILQLVNVDLLGEGVDVPAIEVVSMARPTASYGLYIQQFGRGLRPADGKSHAIIIDHVGNVTRHGLPDAVREWSLDRREKNQSPNDATPMRSCVDHKTDGVVTTKGCFAAFERFLTVCPSCGLEIQAPTPAERTGPEFVDGDLHELDEATLAKMRGEVSKVDMPLDEAVAAYRADLMRRHTPTIGVMAHTKRFAAKHEAQQQAVGALREIMAHWAGHHRAAGRDDGEIFRRFYLRYGVDWLTAQSLSGDDMLALGERVAIDIGSVD
jgi:superfamily II DNA or RNA helicase